MKEKLKTPIISSIVIIFLCFLLTSTGWLSWEYHLLTQVSSRISDLCTMVIGYLLQAVGIGAFSIIIWHKEYFAKGMYISALLLHIACMLPAVLSPYTAGTLVFGFIMNLVCGFIAGYYLYNLGKTVETKRRATVFAVGYSLSILSSWLLSFIGKGAAFYSGASIIISGVLTALLLLLAVKQKAEDVSCDGDAAPGSASHTDFRFLFSFCMLIVLFSIVNSAGFSFPSSDILGTVQVEFTRLIYAAGLIVAGLLTDKSRKHGALLALAALIMPFIMLALRGETLPATVFWALSYFTFGFYAVFRITLFTDIAASYKCTYLACFGLMLGRAGDAMGEAICLAFNDRLLIMVIVTAALFVAAFAVFFKVYSRLYIPEAVREQTEKERFDRFSMEHDLSSRERDMLHLILQDKTVNEIADALSISDNTVKYHVKNILQKTGCKSRKDVIALYTDRYNT